MAKHWDSFLSHCIPIGFLAIPKGMFHSVPEKCDLTQIQGDQRYNNDLAFQRFKCQMYHDTIATILSPLKSRMIVPVIHRCPDGHFRRVIYDLASYIADYPDQIYLVAVVQYWCPK